MSIWYQIAACNLLRKAKPAGTAAGSKSSERFRPATNPFRAVT